ncbi:ClpV1 family T6SS ATPase [Leminorella grimontii]|uniref:ClpV1 family T6SS ATPase n=1 Tax=Leminorella grimontii TaxID=82981 RepID=A0AAV5N3S9_9GAMM|nr:type VI secretion system ATPase TssH [Leminorella grimontii]KFC92872.1 ClpB family protein [Leminorella grimontii ATCC 33999 = DSM 5078]GKX56756.1 ClpV1 family T6SS ATPase [Leminorella grimontii]VFS62237.1 protein disaggregation chaperone [Leminorella grimontii]
MISDPSVLLRRLNPYCAKALEAAASLCQTRAHPEITLEHWLLKLLEQGAGDLTVIARRYELDLDAVWQALLNQLENLPHTVQQKPVLSGVVQELLKSAWLIASLENRVESVRSAHILQALIDNPQWLKARDAWPLLSVSQVQLQRLLPILDELSDENPARVNAPQYEAAESVDSAAAAVASPLAPKVAGAPNASAQPTALDRFTVNLTARAKESKIDPVFGRDVEIRQMVDILSRRRKNNPILVGEPGVGKTALVEGLALRIAEGNVPDSLKPVNIHVLDLGLLQAGAGVKGEFEQRLKNVIDAVQQSPTPILLFIDEAHTIIGAGNQAGGADAANLLKPALARGELRTIAATTWSEYKQYFERDAALERRFQMVKVDEPDDDTAALMLRGLKSRYAQHHGVHILDEAVRCAVALSRRYITGRQLPDKAVDLLDTASARVRMSLDTVPEEITLLEARLSALEYEDVALKEDRELGESVDRSRLEDIAAEKAAVAEQIEALNKQFAEEKAIVERLIALRASKKEQEADGGVEEANEIRELQERLHSGCGGSPLLSLDVDARTVAGVIADWTGVPLESLMKDEQSNLLSLESELAQRVIGQDEALISLAQRLRAAKTGLTPEQGPLGVFLLVGPSGIGKTESALALADLLFGGERSLITINMSEYQEAHTVSQLKGSPPGYVGYGQGGVLTEAVRRRPYSVVLLDEVEKAHRDVINLFYQVFDRGFMRDGEGREIDFRNTVILMTANLGSDQMVALLEAQPESPTALLHEAIYPILRDHFQPALLARFQTVIYRPLGAEALRKIVAIKMGKVAERLQRHYGIEFNVQESLFDTLVSACLLPDSGARNIDSLLNQQILPVLSQTLLSLQSQQRRAKALSLGYSEEEGITLDVVEQGVEAAAVEHVG